MVANAIDDLTFWKAFLQLLPNNTNRVDRCACHDWSGNICSAASNETSIPTSLIQYTSNICPTGIRMQRQDCAQESIHYYEGAIRIAMQHAFRHCHLVATTNVYCDAPVRRRVVSKLNPHFIAGPSPTARALKITPKGFDISLRTTQFTSISAVR